MSDERILEEFCTAVLSYWMLVRGERLGELRGQHSRTFDQRGLHPGSVEIGRIHMCVDLFPELGYLEFSHIELRRDARREAELLFEAEILSRRRNDKD
jgi:hypothetical protein